MPSEAEGRARQLIEHSFFNLTLSWRPLAAKEPFLCAFRESAGPGALIRDQIQFEKKNRLSEKRRSTVSIRFYLKICPEKKKKNFDHVKHFNRFETSLHPPAFKAGG